MKRFLIISKILLFFFVLTTVVNSAELRRIDIKPLNRASFYLTNITSFESILSADKQRVILNISDCKALENAKQKSSSGIIRDIFSKQNGDNLEINISLNGKRGFTCVALPYSQSIVVDIFSWDKLSSSEEIYRQSLLGWKDKTLSVPDLEKSAKENISGANAMLGLYFMREGSPSKAIKYLLKAEINETNIADVYAALSQIYSLKNISHTSEKYAKKFTEMTDLSGFPELPSLDKPSEIILPEKIFSQSEKNNSSTISNASDTIVIKNTNEINENLDFLQEYSEIIFYSLLALVLIFLTLFLIFKYLQKSGNKDAGKMIDSRFAEEVRQAKKASDDKIRKLQHLRGDDSEEKKEEETEKKNVLLKKYQQETQQENIQKKKITEQKKKNLQKQSKKVPKIKKVRIKKQENVKEKNTGQDIENFLENYIPIKRDQQKEDLEKAKDELLLDTDVNNERQTNSPDVNLALHLANEKQKMKQKHISELGDAGDLDRKALEKKAKESGLEISSVETKNLINKLEKDKTKMSKLSNKFSSSPDNNENEEK